MLVSLEIPPVLNVSNHPILLYTTACLWFGLRCAAGPPPAQLLFLIVLVNFFVFSYLLLVFIYLLTSLTHPSLVWSLYRIYALPCAFVLRISIALLPYGLMPLLYLHIPFIYYYGFFLERMSGASIDTYPFIYYLLLLRPYLRTILPHTAYRISPVPANDFILRMSHITSRNTTLPPCLIPLMSHITSHQTTPLRCPLSHPFIITTALQKNNIGALCVHGHISHPIPHYLHLGM